MFSPALSTTLTLASIFAFDRVMDLIGYALDEIGNECDIKPWAAFFYPCWTTLSATSAVQAAGKILLCYIFYDPRLLGGHDPRLLEGHLTHHESRVTSLG